MYQLRSEQWQPLYVMIGFSLCYSIFNLLTDLLEGLPTLDEVVRVGVCVVYCCKLHSVVLVGVGGLKRVVTSSSVLLSRCLDLF